MLQEAASLQQVLLQGDETRNRTGVSTALFSVELVQRPRDRIPHKAPEDNDAVDQLPNFDV